MAIQNEESQPDYARVVSAIESELERLYPEAGPFSEETDLTADVPMDSAASMEMVFTLEETFDVSLPLDQLGDTRTVRDLARLVMQL